MQERITELPLYQSHKIVGAAKITDINPIDLGAAGGVLQLVLALPGGDKKVVSYVPAGKKPIPEIGWYFIQYEDSYDSTSPAEAFESGYAKLDILSDPASTLFDYSRALRLLKLGKSLARKGWNGKDMFIFLVSGSQFVVNRAPLLGIFPAGTPISYWPHIDIKNVDGSIAVWVPSITDQMAEDWFTV